MAVKSEREPIHAVPRISVSHPENSVHEWARLIATRSATQRRTLGLPVHPACQSAYFQYPVQEVNLMERREYRTGSITERKDASGNVVAYQVQVVVPGGKRKTLGTVKTKREAKKLARQGQADLVAGRTVGTSRLTVGQHLDEWLETKRHGLAWKSFVTYRTCIEHAKRHIGRVRLQDLRTADIERCIAALRDEGKGEAMTLKVHSVLHNALHRAVQVDLISRNPCAAAIPPRPKRRERPTLTLDQAYDLFNATQDDWDHPLYVVLTTSGLRLGEALGLRWDDVNLVERTLTIRQALQRQTGRGQVRVDLKTAKSRRVVPLMSVAVEALRRHKVRQAQQRLLLGPEWQDSGHVFTSETGAPLDQSNVRTRRYYPALERAGLPRVRPHDLRHTASTLMASEGIPIHMVQAVLGHARSSTTMEIYTHVLPTSFQEVRDRMDAAYVRVQLTHSQNVS